MPGNSKTNNFGKSGGSFKGGGAFGKSGGAQQQYEQQQQKKSDWFNRYNQQNEATRQKYSGKTDATRDARMEQERNYRQEYAKTSQKKDSTRYYDNTQTGRIKNAGDITRLEGLMKWLESAPDVIEDTAWMDDWGGTGEGDYPWEDWGGGGGGGGGGSYVPEWYQNLYNLNVNR